MERDFTIIKGNNISFKVEFNDLESEVTGAYMSAKKKVNDTAYAFQVSLGNGISIIPDTNSYLVNVPTTLTKNLECGSYYYDLTFVIGTTVITLLNGIMTVNPNITVLA